ncbi:General receptor for phosphoinositides 1-associated scaffold protein [Dissostichus eleginoides]|uniref:General receptor for phosphoinositides 1-associated scaffold protein n=1 Tax=Dissostichus eleginoides TaxID=100907 RepID=A0AAD9FHH9_DISEL|nr:General receptor for phosphoinositides 1-associated scaffold protein [Dissostichus eleginoides]
MTFRRLKKVNSSGMALRKVTYISCPPSRTAAGLRRQTAPRKVVVLEKKEEEAFGFEIQTYGLHHEDQNSVEMCTFVCKVHEDSPAQEAGLKVGDTISSVNEETVEGFRHKEIVQLIRACGNTLRLETVYSDSIRKAEMEARLQYLKQTLHEKWDEYRSLMVQEQRLVHGIVLSDAAVYESLESAGVYGSVGTPSPAEKRSLGCSSGSTSSVQSTNTTEEEPLYTRLQRPDVPPPTDRKLRVRPVSELFSSTKTNLTRSASTRSYLRGGGNTAGEKQGGFTQRKPKQKSFRRRLLKFIPGLNRPLEEEESKL